jgi:catechol 2,3-dioxygenase-like lactoylglutathione lyase family enzyme
MADRALPNLPSRDLDATVAFYSGFGFEVVFRDEGWLILRRGGLQLEFFPFPDLVPAESSFMCTVRVGDVDALWTAIADSGVPQTRQGIPRLVPVEQHDWGFRSGALIDLDGTQLTLIEDTNG